MSRRRNYRGDNGKRWSQCRINGGSEVNQNSLSGESSMYVSGESIKYQKRVSSELSWLLLANGHLIAGHVNSVGVRGGSGSEGQG
ncbi:Hypothetical predicted protein [Octopus vulgaris]|uniref:Uncharacterized protein n=1 Tax=Octopus vulgaris TaxID=6645 RepID=A0AA36BMI8_OCTVU|nr:Hypothetical predicted protein [Octopus vulgaris]